MSFPCTARSVARSARATQCLSEVKVWRTALEANTHAGLEESMVTNAERALQAGAPGHGPQARVVVDWPAAEGDGDEAEHSISPALLYFSSDWKKVCAHPTARAR